MHYAKLFSTILDSSVWRESKETRLVWITMLAMKDRDGCVQAAVPGLADRAKVTLKECVEALRVLSSPDEWSRSKEYDGRRIEEVDGGWRVLNHELYRDKLSQDDRREYNKIKQREYRARKVRVRAPGVKSLETDPARDPELAAMEPEQRRRAIAARQRIIGLAVAQEEVLEKRRGPAREHEPLPEGVNLQGELRKRVREDAIVKADEEALKRFNQKLKQEAEEQEDGELAIDRDAE